MDTEHQFLIEIGPLNFEHVGTPRQANRILGIQADLRITVHGREWFNQPKFPVVELAAAVRSWLGRGGDFQFDTMEAEESPFLWVRHVAGGCVLGAAWQAFEVKNPMRFNTVREVLARFVSEVVATAEHQLSVDVSDLVSRKAG